jgi:site-specific DNA recombinase
MKAINVSRVSQEEQKEALPAQQERIVIYCDRKSYKIIETFSIDESAYRDKRDEFDKLVEFVQKISEKEKVAVCFDKVDRLSRSIFDKRVATLYEMAVADKIELHFVSDGQIINNQMSAVEKFQFGMSLGLAKYYSDAISDNVKRRFEQKRRDGEWTGAVRLGYLNVSLDAEKRLRKDIIIDPERGHLIQKMFELYSTGNYSLETIRQKMIELGLRSQKGFEPSKSLIENILKDSFYCGIAVSKKYGPYAHKYPRLITRELFDRCQEVRLKRQNSPHKARSRDFILKGLMKCQNCGCTMSAEIKTKKSGRTFTYYSCTNAKHVCKRVYIPEKDLLKPIYKVLERLESISEDVQNELIDELRKNTEAELVFHKAQINRIRTEHDKLKEKQDRLLEAYLDQSITKDIYDKKHQEYQDQIQTLEIELSEHNKADYDYQTTVATVISVARRAKTIFENSSEVAGKRAFLNFILQNPVVEDKTLSFELKKPFDLVLNLADAQIKTTAIAGSRPIWLPFVDKFRTVNWSSIENEIQLSGILKLFQSNNLCLAK